jgi:hypothetical protein
MGLKGDMARKVLAIEFMTRKLYAPDHVWLLLIFLTAASTLSLPKESI